MFWIVMCRRSFCLVYCNVQDLNSLMSFSWYSSIIYHQLWHNSSWASPCTSQLVQMASHSCCVLVCWDVLWEPVARTTLLAFSAWSRKCRYSLGLKRVAGDVCYELFTYTSQNALPSQCGVIVRWFILRSSWGVVVWADVCCSKAHAQAKPKGCKAGLQHELGFPGCPGQGA